jgi:hypothetical protein
MRRATLVTDEMRDIAAFNVRVREIDAVCQQPRSKTATRSMIKALMTQLLESPSERTVGYFLEIHERWGHLVDARRFLENRWRGWATFQDRLELIEHKFIHEPDFEELIEAVAEANNWNSTLGLRCQLCRLISTITDQYPQTSRINRELMSLLAWRFRGVINVFRLEEDVQARRRRAPTTKDVTHV